MPDNFSSKANFKKVAVFASGAGSNALKIIEHFKNHPTVSVSLIVCNNPKAGVLNIAAANNIAVLMISRDKFINGDGYVEEFKQAEIDFIVLAGFLWLVPQRLIEAFRNRIINIHPALLPKWGGKGMYGSKVHEAVIAAGDIESGITIHFVDEHYDNGDVIAQFKCEVLPGDTAENLAERIHQLEHKHYPKVVEECVLKA